MAVDNPADGGQNVHIVGGSISGTVNTGAAPTPAAATSIISANTLPAAGAYETAPTTSSSTGIAIPVGTVASPIRGCTLTVLYTQGASSGQMAIKVYEYDGTKWSQAASPVDQSYAGIALGAGTGQYGLSVALTYGATRIFVCGAETGVTGTPGAYSCEAVFG